MVIKKSPDIRTSEITPRRLYLDRRNFLRSAAAILAARVLAPRRALAADKLNVTKRMVTTTDPLTPYTSVTTFNNFYEFGSDKGDPAKNAVGFKARPWSLAVEGACAKP